MMHPEYRIKSRYLDDTHVSQAEDIVNTVMERFKVANGPAVGLVADLVERLIRSQ